jgi:hypothetical protein
MSLGQLSQELQLQTRLQHHPSLKTRALIVSIGLICLVCAGCFQHRVRQIETATEKLKKNPADKHAMDILRRFLSVDDPYLRAQAVIALGNLGDSHGAELGAQVVPLLNQKLDDNVGSVRRNAVLALSHYKVYAYLSVTNVVKVLSQFPTHDSAWFAADLLGDLGTNAVGAIPALVTALGYSASESGGYENSLSSHAAGALYKLSAHAPNVSAQLGPILRSLKGDAKLYGSLAVLRNNPENAEADRSFAEVLQSDDAGLVISALREFQNCCVQGFGPQIKSAIARCSTHSNANVRSFARQISSRQDGVEQGTR